jgi:hypothetical protein
MQMLIQVSKKLAIYLLPLVIMFFLLFQYHKGVQQKLEAKIAEQEMLTKAMHTQMVQIKNENGELVSTKISLQANMKEIQKNYEYLSKNQKKIVDRMSKDKKAFAGAIADMEVVIDSLKATGEAINDSTVAFIVNSDTISFNATVSGVTALKIDPELEISKMVIPNETTIVFNWGEKKDGYPASVSLINSNPMFQVNNIDSYVIPEIKKEELKPTFFQKIGRGISTGKTPFLLGVGVGAAGVVATSMLLK